jgi:hypothetical protein
MRTLSTTFASLHYKQQWMTEVASIIENNKLTRLEVLTIHAAINPENQSSITYWLCYCH